MKPLLKLVIVLCLGIAAPFRLARAQEVSAFLGFGSLYDDSSRLSIDTFGDGTLHKTPTLSGPFGQIGMNVYFGRQWGFGAEISRRLVQGDYAGVDYSPSFSSFDFVYRPARATTRRFEPEFRVGLGAARLHYSPDDQGSCAQVPGCPVSTHFQVRFAVAERVYISNHLFLRPALDLHYVNGFSEFRSDWAPEFSLGVGYALGR